MPRDSNGVFTLESGNPVITNTLITATWANLTLEDIAYNITNSLSRDGEGGMEAPLMLIDGSIGSPALSWPDDTSSGFYRADTNDIRLTVAGVDKMRWTATEVAEFNLAGIWTSIEDIGGTSAISVESRSITYTFVLDDAQTYQLLTGATPRTWQVPPNSSVAYPVGTCIVVACEAAALTLDPGAGVTFNSPIAQASTDDRTVVAGGTAVLTKTATDTWQLTGDII